MSVTGMLQQLRVASEYRERNIRAVMTPNIFPGIIALIIVALAVRGFRQAYNPIIRAERIRVTSVAGREFWMPLWWRPFTLVTTVALGAAALAYLAVLIFSQ
jgi:hypothetical protein